MPATRDQRWHRILDMACMLSDRNFRRWRRAVEAYPLQVYIVTNGGYDDYMISSVHPTLREAMDSVPGVGSWEQRGDRWRPQMEDYLRDTPDWFGRPVKLRRELYPEHADTSIEVWPLSCPFPEWLENAPRMIDQAPPPLDPNGSPGRSNDDPAHDSGA